MTPVSETVLNLLQTTIDFTIDGEIKWKHVSRDTMTYTSRGHGLTWEFADGGSSLHIGNGANKITTSMFSHVPEIQFAFLELKAMVYHQKEVDGLQPQIKQILKAKKLKSQAVNS